MLPLSRFLFSSYSFSLLRPRQSERIRVLWSDITGSYVDGAYTGYRQTVPIETLLILLPLEY